MKSVEYIGTLPDAAVVILGNLVTQGEIEKLVVVEADESEAA